MSKRLYVITAPGVGVYIGFEGARPYWSLVAPDIEKPPAVFGSKGEANAFAANNPEVGIMMNIQVVRVAAATWQACEDAGCEVGDLAHNERLRAAAKENERGEEA